MENIENTQEQDLGFYTHNHGVTDLMLFGDNYDSVTSVQEGPESCPSELEVSIG